MKQALKEIKDCHWEALIILNCGNTFTAEVSDIREDVVIFTNVKSNNTNIIRYTISIAQIAGVGVYFDNSTSFI